MYGKVSFLILLAALNTMVGICSAVEVRVDFGAGDAVPGWTQWVPGGWGDPEGKTIDGVDFTIVGPWDNWRTRLRGDYGDDLTGDCASFEDAATGSMTLTVSNLPAGEYKLVSYHNSLYDHIQPVIYQSVDGSPQGSGLITVGQNKDSCLQLTAIFSVTGPGDIVSIDYSVTASFVFLSGFELVSTSPMIRFEKAESGDLETLGPAVLEVIILNAEAAHSYTVDYGLIGGTAVEDEDFTFTQPATLTFEPGQASKTITINIIDDGEDEEDETIVLGLSSPTGGAVLGSIAQHTYTIRDPKPDIGFETDSAMTSEDLDMAMVPVSLSFATTHTVEVNYTVIGGTAAGGGVDYTLEPDKLVFDPGQSTQYIPVTLVDDGVEEDNETIILELSGIAGAHPAITEHTLEIADPTVLELAVDLALEAPWNSGIADMRTVKPGWIPWTAEGWGDLYMHDLKTIRNLGGTDVDASITLAREGTGGLKCYDMCMCGKGGGCPPNGDPVGGPIANTWFASVDRVSYPQASVLLALHNLPVGAYALVSYHNLWQPCSDDSRECTKCGYSGPAMPEIHIWSFADANEYGQELALSYPQYTGQFYDALNKIKGAAGPNQTDNVIALQQAYDVLPSHTTNDSDVTRSVIEFWTDGSTVVIMYEAALWSQTQYIGGRAVLNAFRLLPLKNLPLAFSPVPVDGAEDVDPATTLTWETGMSAASHDVYLGTDFDEVKNADTSTAGIYRGRQASTEYDPSEALELGNTYYWRVDEVNDVNIWTGNVWSFTIDAGQVRDPSPVHGASDVLTDAALSWSPGIVAGSHDVYFGTDYEAVRDADTSSDEYKANQNIDANSYDPDGVLLLGTTYYWRIDEVNPGYTDSKGDVWSFTTAAYIVFDDMESYCGDYGCGNEIYDTWRDGWENGTSSTIVLGEYSFDPVHGGSQSMVYAYYNQFDPYYSEVDRDVGEQSNWTGLGLKAIVLYFYGSTGNSLERLYLGLEDSTGAGSYSEVVYATSGDLQVEDWHEWDVTLNDLAAGGVDLTDVNRIYIGFGNRDNPTQGSYGSVAIDDIVLYAYKCVLPGPTGDLTDDCIVDYKDVKMMSDVWLGSDSAADLYSDGTVDFRDYCVLAENWLAENLWP